jgi:ectoine hydroxylase-related dioxygenase (phytanoyl-CoA dioxygenase family)
MERRDAHAGTSRLWLTDALEDDIYSAFVRCLRIVEPLEQILGGEVYHYHHKMMLKEPFVGGSWEWHQDYGYWYQNGCLYPDLLSVAVALEPATRENGCMQVLKGSHLMGRIEHGRVAGQTGADPERVEQALKRLELVYCEMEPGDALFFHSNTLHCSAANLSPRSRNLLICCYNKATNDPYKEHHHPRYTRLDIVPDEAVLAAGARIADAAGRWFLEEGKDETTETRKAG